MMKIAGMVTLYHPDDGVAENIKSYLDDLDFLYVLDNTEEPDSKWADFFCKIENVQYISFCDNKGISYALNYALREADEAGYKFLLTMDQDSRFSPGAVKQYKELIEAYASKRWGSVAMYAVAYDHKEKDEKPREIEVGITSGSVLLVAVAKKIGGFDEALFIDEVDYEYCYRAADHGYKIVEFPGIFLRHSIGARTYHSVFGFRYNTFNHAPIRRYYIARNHVYIFCKYPRKRVKYTINLIKTVIKIVLAEKNKSKKLRYMARGIWDGICGHMGKYKER